MPDEHDELRQDIEADKAYRRARSVQATALNKIWKTKQPKERLRAWEKKNRKRMTAYKIAQRRKRKIELVALHGGVCADCRGTFPPCVFDFHHTDPSKKTNILAMMFQYKLETILKELEHCVMICANCHRIRHDKQTD